MENREAALVKFAAAMKEVSDAEAAVLAADPTVFLRAEHPVDASEIDADGVCHAAALAARESTKTPVDRWNAFLDALLADEWVPTAPRPRFDISVPTTTAIPGIHSIISAADRGCARGRDCCHIRLGGLRAARDAVDMVQATGRPNGSRVSGPPDLPTPSAVMPPLPS